MASGTGGKVGGFPEEVSHLGHIVGSPLVVVKPSVSSGFLTAHPVGSGVGDF